MRRRKARQKRLAGVLLKGLPLPVNNDKDPEKDPFGLANRRRLLYIISEVAHMKKRGRVKIIILVVLLVLACVPMHVYMSDGGSQGWYAILWQYTKFHEIRGNGWRVGPQVTLLGFIPIYDGTKIIDDEEETTPETSEQTAADSEAFRTFEEESLGHVAWVGTVPQEFSTVIETNAFAGAVAVPGGVLKAVSADTDNDGRFDTADIFLMDPYGNEIGRCQYDLDGSHIIQTLTATSDGGFLFVYGFEDHAFPTGGWSSEGGFESCIVKCARSGEIEWTLSLPDCEGWALQFCLEKNGSYYVFGSKEAPETKRIGVASISDVQILRVSTAGELEQTVLFSGSDYDWFQDVEPLPDGFLLYLSSQSSDGDFAYEAGDGFAKSWQFVLDGDLQCVSKEQGSDGFGFRSMRIGVLDGKTIREDDPLFANYDAGLVNLVLDYDGFYLVVSNNLTEEIETPPYVSARWYNSETVYSAFDKTGKLLWRSAVDNQ